MDLKKVKKRQRKALRNGKNTGRFNKQLTNQEKKARIIHHLENFGLEILEAAKEHYKVDGRGYANISLTNHPNKPFKTGKLYYVTEKGNKEIESRMPFLTENDIRISEGISIYKPTSEAVVCVWYDMMCFVTTLTKTYAEFDAAFENESLTIH
jgi:hypothetical protein